MGAADADDAPINNESGAFLGTRGEMPASEDEGQAVEHSHHDEQESEPRDER